MIVSILPPITQGGIVSASSVSDIIDTMGGFYIYVNPWRHQCTTIHVENQTDHNSPVVLSLTIEGYNYNTNKCNIFSPIMTNVHLNISNTDWKQQRISISNIL